MKSLAKRTAARVMVGAGKNRADSKDWMIYFDY